MKVQIMKENDENTLLEAIQEIQAKMKEKDNKLTFEKDLSNVKKRKKIRK